MRTVAGLTMLVVLLAPPPAQAQGDALQPELDLTAGHLAGEAEDGIAPIGVGELVVPWVLAFPSAAHASAELAQDAAITWTVACDAPLGVSVPPTLLEPVAGQDAYSGEAVITLDPRDDTPGVVDITCDVTGQFTGATTQATDTIQAAVQVLFDAQVAFEVQDEARESGPQKIIRYPIAVTNGGNAAALVNWDILERPAGRWNLVLPDPVVLAPGENVTVHVLVATTFENGYVSDKAAFTLQAFASAAFDPDQVGPRVDLTLQATAKGWYIPGPSPALLVGAMAALAALARRNA